MKSLAGSGFLRQQHIHQHCFTPANTAKKIQPFHRIFAVLPNLNKLWIDPEWRLCCTAWGVKQVFKMRDSVCLTFIRPQFTRAYLCLISARGEAIVITVAVLPCPSLTLPLNHELFDFADSLARIEALWAGFRTIHNGMTTVQAERIFQRVKSFPAYSYGYQLSSGRLKQEAGPRYHPRSTNKTGRMLYS